MAKFEIWKSNEKDARQKAQYNNINIFDAVKDRNNKHNWIWWQEWDFTTGGKDTDKNSISERSRRVSVDMLKNMGLVLDVGCCGGWLSLEIIKRGNKVIGIDLPKVVKQAINQNRGMLVAGDACSMSFKNNVFDAVYASELIEHLFEPEDFIAECYRILKDNGKLVIATPWDKEASLIHPTHRCWFCPETIKELLQKHSFHVNKIEMVAESRIMIVEGSKRN